MESRASFVSFVLLSSSGISFDIDGNNDPRTDAFLEAYGRDNIAVIVKKKRKKDRCFVFRPLAGTRLPCQVSK